MPKKNTKTVQGKSEIIQSGPITLDKSGGIVIKINAKPGAKNNNITGIIIWIAVILPTNSYNIVLLTPISEIVYIMTVTTSTSLVKN